MVSVLVGVVAAAGGHFFWAQPSTGDPADITLARDPAPDLSTEGHGPAGGAEPGSTTSATPSDSEQSPPATESNGPSGTGGTQQQSTPETSSSDDPPTTTHDSTDSTDSTSSNSPAESSEEAPPPTGTIGEPTSGTADPAEQVVERVNAERADAGCAAVRVDRRLVVSAQRHSDDMAEHHYLDHTSQDGTTFDERIDDAGYPAPAAENIAMGMASAEAVMEAWMDSDGHRRNILNCEITTIGVGVNSDGWYWTQNFGY